ncbi:CapA family protein [Cellulomonas cellasea]|uniref:CapA family protein n=1 Tax=Cellulomonas cellasea TaxID=43670 RepID=UPI0025A332A4|nr:CapA family protein [Cellulomonas cellasea]MDM8085774.1 CapA family protein [Cellulomonas cellasea]
MALASPGVPVPPVGVIRPIVDAALDTATPTPVPTPTADPDAVFTIVAAGDVLPHLPVIASARTTSGGYDFAPLLSPFDAWVQGADLALCHLETPVAPADGKPSGYPRFGSPVEIAQGLADAGWDGCSTASNHSADRGFAGIAATLEALDVAGMGHVGTARSAVEQGQPQLYILERAGQRLTVAHLAATYGTNGMPVDADKPWSVDLLDTARLVAQAEAARAAGADLVVASVHCCVEYVTEPTARQAEVAQALADSAVVDLMIGHHAHVPQPVARLEGGPGGLGMWVAYGLGNLLSNQDSECCVAGTESGLLLTAQVTSTGAFPAQGVEAGPARVTDVQWTPTTVDRRSGHRLHALVDIPGGTQALTPAEVATRAERVRAAAGTEAVERTRPTTPTGPEPLVVARTDVA